MTAINHPKKLSMSHQGTANFGFLAFEQKRTEHLNSECAHKLLTKNREKNSIVLITLLLRFSVDLEV